MKPLTPTPIKAGEPPAPVGSTGDGSAANPSTATAIAPEAKVIAGRNIKVNFAKPWLATEADLDGYLQKLREAWLSEIQAGNRVQI